MLNKLGRTRLVEVLLVEDSPTDAILLEEAFKDTKIPNNLHIVTTGEDALAYLRHEGVHAKSLMPDLIMLDLNLPGISGQDVLKTIKGDEKLKSIPVVVLTTSKAEEDITKAYKHHANCYVTKPVGYDKLADLVYSIETFWLGIVSLPRGEK